MIEGDKKKRYTIDEVSKVTTVDQIHKAAEGAIEDVRNVDRFVRSIDIG